jgi:hypothetical protein
MKKTFLITLSLLSFSAFADDVKIINIGAVTSPTAMYANAYAKNLQISNTFVPAKSCRDAMAIAEKEPSVLLVPNDIYLQAQRLGQECSPKLTPSKILITSDAYFDICKKPGSDKTFNSPNVTVGRASVHPIKEWEYDFNKRNSTSVKGVAFSGSKTVLAAVLNGDADWGFIAREIAEPAIKEGRIECPYNTEASSPKSLHKKYSMINEEYVLKYILITNVTDESLLKSLKAAAANPAFLDYLKASKHTNISTNPTQTQVDSYLKSVDQLNVLLDSYNKNK